VIVISSIGTLIIFYHQPSPTKLYVNISLNQTNVIQGNNLQALVNVTSIGKAENVTLSSNSGSSGINCTFEPYMGKSNFTSTLTMSVPDSTPTGNYTLTVKAVGNGQEQNASFVVFVYPLQLDVTVSINQTNVYQGGSLQAEVNVKSNGKPENVTLSYSADSSGIDCSFKPAMGTSNFTSTITMNVPDSTPSGNYSITVTASAGGAKENSSSYAISVLGANELSPTVTVSGTVEVGIPLLGFGIRLNAIVFVDTQTNSTTFANLPTTYPYGNQNPASGTYSVILENEHTYNVTVSVFLGPNNEESAPETFKASLYVYAPAGNTTMPGQDFFLSF